MSRCRCIVCGDTDNYMRLELNTGKAIEICRQCMYPMYEALHKKMNAMFGGFQVENLIKEKKMAVEQLSKGTCDMCGFQMVEKMENWDSILCR